ncbi:MAG: hypothetical protein L0I80_12580 [Brevibacterium sp.]|nr:hypothetical protein [Brevibacterium sp.]
MNELSAPLPSAGDGPRRRPNSIALGLACLDGSALVVSWFLVVSLFGGVWGGDFLLLLPTLVIGQLGLGYLLSLYRNRYQLGSDRELRNQGLVAAILFTGTALAGAVPNTGRTSPGCFWLCSSPKP